MSVNKVQLANGETIIDISDSTVTPETLAKGATAYDASGKKIIGQMVGSDDSTIVRDAYGTAIILYDSVQRHLGGLNLYGKTVQNGTPTPNAPVELETVGNSGSITVKIGTSEADTNPQILTVQTPNGLPGIPVSSGGNYTDENGKMWVCDEIDFAKGKYVQRIKTLVLNGSEYCHYNSSVNAPFFIEATGIADCTYNDIRLLCDGYQAVPISASWRNYDTMVSRSSETTAALCFRNVNYTTADAFKASLADSPIKVQYILKTPIETSLTAGEIAQYSSLHTNYPTTTIYNDAGAEMAVKYVADTKLYIDAKYTELATAILNA